MHRWEVATFEVRRINRLPANFDEFVGEVGDAMGSLYGPGARSAYRTKARRQVQAAIALSDIRAYTAEVDGVAAGMLSSYVIGDVVRVTFLHVLKRYAGKGVESALIPAAFHDAASLNPVSYLHECVPFGQIQTESAYGALGFSRVDRLTMMGPTKACARDAALRSAVLAQSDLEEAAELLVDAYEGHPDRVIHPDVRDVHEAQRFVRIAAAGGYGEFRPGMCRALRRDGRLVGVLLGCLIDADVGFVLQVAVRRDAQGRGVGTELMRDVAHVFASAGASRQALGVSVGNPARKLYARLGYRDLLKVPAYAWWRDWALV